MAFAFSALTLSGCGYGDETSGGDGGVVTAAGGGTVEVSMKNTRFNPADLVIDRGTTVVWTNDDSFTHTITADDDSFDSGGISGGEKFELTFDEAKTIEYGCTIHPGMDGKITVR